MLSAVAEATPSTGGKECLKIPLLLQCIFFISGDFPCHVTGVKSRGLLFSGVNFVPGNDACFC